MNVSETFAFLFIGFGLILIDQALFFRDPILALVVAGCGLCLVGTIIWFRGRDK